MHLERTGFNFALLKAQDKLDREIAHNRRLGLTHATGTVKGLFEDVADILGLNAKEPATVYQMLYSLHDLKGAAMLIVSDGQDILDSEVTISNERKRGVTFGEGIHEVLDAVECSGVKGLSLEQVQDEVMGDGSTVSYRTGEVEDILHVLAGLGYVRESVQPSFYGRTLTLYHATTA